MEFDAFIQREIVKWREIAADSGIRLN
jgi:hypothetical protein